ncbi:hypothetical protein YYC_02222 [Plasmodium yoelii 17X]|uniref:RNA-binding protein, putative n=2 Tax=Plasmodium yoelii TaxID=5861 RepID=A0A078K0D1_PLAYE|nr:RNA-binding protein, putative [Plasmodium yoelii]ETB60585.1 hypothetical protein YYC_02222 [Plasmodium yoelii 17X]CDU16158.1 RNA-binding protein, putative [Plasmodium yoelii]VTZ71786.1 RNA-binding protein, putative [Plasmodium yoelii]|eukprot:XP_022811388.1 RNA-binding protein, putative [Plasmodium yoelii]
MDKERSEAESINCNSTKEENQSKENEKEKNKATNLPPFNELNIEQKKEQDEWVIYVCNNSYGPYNLDQIINLWNTKRINMMTTIFKKGENNWKYVYNDETLVKHFQGTQSNTTNIDNTTSSYNNEKDASNNHLLNKQLNNNNTNSGQTQNHVNKSNENDFHQKEIQYSTNNLNGNNVEYDNNDTYNNNLNYNNVDNNTATNLTNENEANQAELEKIKKRNKKKKYLERKKKKIEEGICERKIKNSSVYISGLPKDVTQEEINNVFKKAGIIKIDSETTKPKIKIYYDENNNVKGDALVTYVYTQSVDIAIKYFDKFHFRQNCVINVEKAQFNKKVEHHKISKEEILIKKKKIQAAKHEQYRLQNWGEVYTGSKKKIVIFRNAFSYEDALKYDEGDPFYDFIKNLIEIEVKKYVPVHKVYPIPKHPHGIVCVKFKGVEEAEMIIEYFKDVELNDKKLEVYFYDGKQDLKAQCLPPQNKPSHIQNVYENISDPQNTDDKLPPVLLNNNLQSFHDWLDNQSEDEEHEIMVE